MSISKIFKICAFCYVAYLGINVNDTIASNLININDINLVDSRLTQQSYIYTETRVDNNIFKHVYNNKTMLNINNDDIISIYVLNNKKMSLDSNEVKTAFGNLQSEKFNNLKQLLSEDFITYLERNVKQIFGNNYKIYFNCRNHGL